MSKILLFPASIIRKSMAFTLLVFVFMSFSNLSYAAFDPKYSWTANSFLNKINKERKKEKLGNLKLNQDLNFLAKKRLDDLISNNYFDHASPTGNDIDYILKSSNYKYDKRGENLAYGEFDDEGDVVKGWMNSRWHKYNILYADFNNVGIAQRVTRDYMGGEYVVVVTVFTKEDSKEAVVKKQKAKTLSNVYNFLKINTLPLLTSESVSLLKLLS